MKLLKLGAILLAAPLMWSLQTGSVKAQSEVGVRCLKASRHSLK